MIEEEDIHDLRIGCVPNENSHVTATANLLGFQIVLVALFRV